MLKNNIAQFFIFFIFYRQKQTKQTNRTNKKTVHFSTPLNLNDTLSSIWQEI